MKLTERVLENEYVRLEPLRDSHREPLREAANADQEIWTSLYPFSMAGEHFDPLWARIQKDQSTGAWIPFAVIVSDQCVGLTCYIRPEAANRCVDIGSTYYRPEFRGGVVNPAAKHLLLGNAFACGANRVQFGVDSLARCHDEARGHRGGHSSPRPDSLDGTFIWQGDLLRVGR